MRKHIAYVGHPKDVIHLFALFLSHINIVEDGHLVLITSLDGFG
jgi:hypothetical protein